MEHEIKLKIHQTVYDAVKDEIKHESRRYAPINWVPLLFFVIFVVFMNYLMNKPSYYETWKQTCNFIVTTDTETLYLTGRSNIDLTGVKAFGIPKINYLRELDCK